jgi:hypothetical protein
MYGERNVGRYLGREIYVNPKPGRKSSGGQGLPDRAAERAGHDEGEKEGSKGLSRQKFSKSTLCVFRLGRSTEC